MADDKTKICECGTSLPTGAKFCPECGKQVADTRGEAGTLAAAQPAPSSPPPDSAEHTMQSRAAEARGRITRSLEGVTLDGRLKLLRLLGSGGFGAVYLARDLHLQMDVAVKVLQAPRGDAGRAWKRFMQEARILLGLNHPAIVRVYYVLELEGFHCLIMEYVKGSDLQRWLTERWERGEQIDVETVLELAYELLDALDYAHNQPNSPVHRDIKPGNIMIRPDGRAVLLDFGIAKLTELADSRLSTAHQRPGTLHFMAREQCVPGLEVDARTDLYALAVVLFHMLTQSYPEGYFDWPSQVREDCPEAVDDFLRRLLRDRKEERFPSAAKALEALADVRLAVTRHLQQLRAERVAGIDRELDRLLLRLADQETLPHGLKPLEETLAKLREIARQLGEGERKTLEAAIRTEKAAETTRRAVSLLLEGAPQAALEALRPLLREQPDRESLFRLYERCRQELEREREREKAQRRAERISKLVQAGDAALERRDRRRLSTCIDRLRSTAPDHEALERWELALQHWETEEREQQRARKLAETRSELERALADEDPTRARAICTRLQELGEKDSVIVAFDGRITALEQRLELRRLLALGDRALEEGRVDAAADAYEKALSIAPENEDARKGRDRALRERELRSREQQITRQIEKFRSEGRIAEALAFLIREIKDAPDLRDRLAALRSTLEEELQTREVAASLLEQARELLEAGKLDDAAALARQATAVAPNLPGLRDLQTELDRRQQEAARQARERQAAIARALSEGEACLQRQLPDEAIAHFEKALELAPDSREARAGLERARRLAALRERIAGLEQTSAEQIQRGEYDQALRTLQELATLEGVDARAVRRRISAVKKQIAQAQPAKTRRRRPFPLLAAIALLLVAVDGTLLLSRGPEPPSTPQPDTNALDSPSGGGAEPPTFALGIQPDARSQPSPAPPEQEVMRRPVLASSPAPTTAAPTMVPTATFAPSPTPTPTATPTRTPSPTGAPPRREQRQEQQAPPAKEPQRPQRPTATPSRTPTPTPTATPTPSPTPFPSHTPADTTAPRVAEMHISPSRPLAGEDLTVEIHARDDRSIARIVVRLVYPGKRGRGHTVEQVAAPRAGQESRDFTTRLTFKGNQVKEGKATIEAQCFDSPGFASKIRRENVYIGSSAPLF
jgi:serine/threonine-protein kinase